LDQSIDAGGGGGRMGESGWKKKEKENLITVENQ